MSETLSLFRSSFNKSLRIESRPERLTGEPGAIVLREIMDRTRVIELREVVLKGPGAVTPLTIARRGWGDTEFEESLPHKIL